MPFSFVVFLSLVVLNQSLFDQNRSESDQAEILIAAGQQHYQEGEYQKASDSFAKSTSLFEKLNDRSGLAKSLNMLGECEANLNHCEQADKILSRSLTFVLANFEPGSAEVADTYYYVARALGGCSRKHDEAISFLRKSIDLKNKLYGEGPEIAYDYSYLGYVFDNKGQNDSAYYYLSKALSIRKKNLPSDDIETSNTLHNLARNYENKSELGKAIELLQKSYEIRKAKLNPRHVSISNSLNQLGSVYQKLGNFDRALDYYQKALEIRIKALGPNHVNVAASYFSIGNLYGSMYNYLQAIHYIKQGATIFETIYGTKSDILPTYFAYLGKLYGDVGDPATAELYLRKAQAMAEKNLKPDHLYLAIVYNIIGDYNTDNNSAPKGLEYYKKALVIFRKSEANSTREADVLSKIGATHSKKKKYDVALEQYRVALSIYRSKMGDRNPKVAELYQLIGDTYFDMQQLQTALSNYQKALTAVSTGFEDSSKFFRNPEINQVDHKPLALRIINHKASVLEQLQKGDPENIDLLKQSLRTQQFALTLLDEISSSYQLEKARIELEKESRDIYHRTMNIVYQLYTKTNDKRFIHDAFAISEKSKSVMLLENIRDSQAKFQAGVPDSLIEKERDIKIELAYYQSTLHQAERAKDSVMVALQEKNIFEAQQKYDKLKSTLEKQFPAYYTLKYQSSIPSLDKIRTSLKEETALVEFYLEDSSIYKFTVSKNILELEKIMNDSLLRQLMNNYEKGLTNSDFIVNSPHLADQFYSSSAYALYNKLLKSSLEVNKTPITKLIIIPDDRLAQFSFGTLLTLPVKEESIDYKNLNYLTKYYSISYAYSASLLDFASYKSMNTKSKFGGFAPSYSGNQFQSLDTLAHPLVQWVVRSGNLPLPGAIEEVKQISQFMQGDSWVNEEANETNFKKNAAGYQILHLAMHSLLDNENPRYSELLFNHENDVQNDGYLNVDEIYNLKLNAALVVLSACSSGFGKIQAGEGPISISRAFSYAGCPSVVMSLWKIPDGVTRQIMTIFYQELKNGKLKDEALQIAQHKFLNDTQDPLYHHPYFWAGFVVMGDTNSISDKSRSWIMYSTIGVLLLSLVFFGIRKRSH